MCFAVFSWLLKASKCRLERFISQQLIHVHHLNLKHTLTYLLSAADSSSFARFDQFLLHVVLHHFSFKSSAHKFPVPNLTKSSISSRIQSAYDLGSKIFLGEAILSHQNLFIAAALVHHGNAGNNTQLNYCSHKRYLLNMGCRDTGKRHTKQIIKQ